MKSSVLEAPKSLDIVKKEPEPHGPIYFEPLYNQILVRVLDRGDMSSGKIYLPQTGQAAMNAAKYAEVVAVGDGHRSSDGKIFPLKCKVGDRIYFAALAGAEIRLGGQTYHITREEEVMGIMRDPKPLEHHPV